MNHPSDREQLLAELLAEGEPTGFRAALLNDMLGLAARRRRVRRFRHAVAALAVLGLLGPFAWHLTRRGPALGAVPVADYSRIGTEPLSASAIIHTQPLAASCEIVTVASVEVIRTTAGRGSVRNLNDDELLALAAPRPAALIRIGPASERLIFLNPVDQRNFPEN